MPKVKTEKKYTAFFSFADPDKELVECLRDLFNALEHKTFFSLKELGKTGTPEWRKEIIEEIKASCCFVPIYTRHSIQRPWVLYESGVADSIGLDRFPVRVSSVSISEIGENPSSGATPLVCDLFSDDVTPLRKFLTGVCQKRGDKTAAEVKKRVNEILVSEEELVNRIRALSKTRWVFVAGNTPKNLGQIQQQKPWFASKEDYELRLRNFTVALTTALINRGFSLCACPQVESVGMHVIATAAHRLTHSPNEPIDYRLGGIHPVDQYTRLNSIDLSEKVQKHWRQHIRAFREKYLHDQEWLVLLGGNEGTRDEYEAARKCKVKVLPVPCFGGEAEKIWNDSARGIKEACGACAVQGVADSKCIEQIVEFMWRNSI